MILYTGARTDTAQYSSEWLLKRFEEGYVLTRNPMFPHKITRYELSPDKVDADFLKLFGTYLFEFSARAGNIRAGEFQHGVYAAENARPAVFISYISAVSIKSAH